MKASMLDSNTPSVLDKDKLHRQLDSYRRSLDLLEQQRQLYIGEVPPQVNRDILTLQDRIEHLRLQLENQ